MNLLYKKIGFRVVLEKINQFDTPIPFLFRSIIGFQLRNMCCIARNNHCDSCPFNATCIYGLTFESIIPKDNPALEGRDRISHPIIIDTEDFFGGPLDSFLVNIIFLGPAVHYIPYFFYALKKGGESGVAKERIPYEIGEILEYSPGGKTRPLNFDDANMDIPLEPDMWSCNINAEDFSEKELKIILETPLRFKSEGRYVRQLTASDFAKCLHRRTQVLCSQYGENDFTGEYIFSKNFTIGEKRLVWKDFIHYSSRQRKAMRLGGLTGDFTLSGKFSSYEIDLLRFAAIFHGGKNTNFGLGKMAVREYGRL